MTFLTLISSVMLVSDLQGDDKVLREKISGEWICDFYAIRTRPGTRDGKHDPGATITVDDINPVVYKFSADKLTISDGKSDTKLAFTLESTETKDVYDIDIIIDEKTKSCGKMKILKDQIVLIFPVTDLQNRPAKFEINPSDEAILMKMKKKSK